LNDEIQKVDFAPKSVFQPSEAGDAENIVKPILEEILLLTRTISNKSAVFVNIDEILTSRLNENIDRAVQRLVRISSRTPSSLGTSPARLSKKDMVDLSNMWINFRHLWQDLLPDLEAARTDSAIEVIGIRKELAERLESAVRDYESFLLSLIDHI
jgi:hypothetical protein